MAIDVREGYLQKISARYRPNVFKADPFNFWDENDHAI
jgi:hypothetical protein